MKTAKNLKNIKFGFLTPIKYIPGTVSIKGKWKCICDCGEITGVQTCNLLTKHTRSCGYFNALKVKLRMTKHGEAEKTPEWRAWVNMKTRCYNNKTWNYMNYGGRGIKVCPQWVGKNGYISFLKDMGRKPNSVYSLDRIDVNGNYEPNNCRWATPMEQRHNRRDSITKFYEARG